MENPPGRPPSDQAPARRPMPKTFSEHEIAAIIGRAVERQRAAEREAEASPAAPLDEPVGLTLDELEQVGRAAGLDPAHLRAAADEVSGGAAPGAGAFAERWADAPLTDAGWEDVVAYLRSAPAPFALPYEDGERPTVERVGRSYEWTRTEEITDTTTRVNVSPRGDGTRVQVWGSSADPGSPVTAALSTAAVTFVLAGILVAVFELAGLAAGTAIAAAAGAALGAVAFFAMRAAEPEAARDEADRVRAIADAVTAAIVGGAAVHAAEAEREPPASRAEEVTAPPDGGRLGAGLLDPELSAPAAGGAPRQRRQRGAA